MLRCHFRHRAYDAPFLHPGLQDMAAWVDFKQVAALRDSKLSLRQIDTDSQFEYVNTQ